MCSCVWFGVALIFALTPPPIPHFLVSWDSGCCCACARLCLLLLLMPLLPLSIFIILLLLYLFVESQRNKLSTDGKKFYTLRETTQPITKCTYILNAAPRLRTKNSWLWMNSFIRWKITKLIQNVSTEVKFQLRFFSQFLANLNEIFIELIKYNFYTNIMIKIEFFFKVEKKNYNLRASTLSSKYENCTLLELEISNVLVKPFNWNELQNRIRSDKSFHW